MIGDFLFKEVKMLNDQPRQYFSKPIIAIDFDGTLIEPTDNYPIPKEFKPKAKSVIKALHEHGCALILWTSRSCQPLIECKSFLKDHDMLQYFEKINEPLFECLCASCGMPKVYADYYIDDHSLFCEEIDWEKIYQKLCKIYGWTPTILN